MSPFAEVIADDAVPIVGVGLKMFLGYAESLQYLRDVAALDDVLGGTAAFVLPSFPVLPAAREILAGAPVAFGAQDGHWEDAGPFTGSVSPTMLAELGCELGEIGHAERRRDFAEDDAMIARKAAALARAGVIPLVCVGEQETPHNAAEVVRRQVGAVLDALPDEEAVIFAYEPAWAIGVERPAAAEHIERIIAVIRATAGTRRGTVRVIYGGSVAPGSASELLATGADGLFVCRSALAAAGLELLAREIVSTIVTEQ